MELALSPEVKMARRLIKIHSIEVPFDLKSLVQKYAEVYYKSFPIDGVDGICLHLKTAGRIPKVIVNTEIHPKRQNFTLAHELGHIIIPWHYGTIVDMIGVQTENYSSSYSKLESEANRFASELLMPFDWIFSMYQKNSDLRFLINQIQVNCNVSELAAEIRLRNAIIEIEQKLMPLDLILEIFNQNRDLAETQHKIMELTSFSPKRVAELLVRGSPISIAYCLEINNKVIGSGSSYGTHFYYQSEGEEFVESPYKYFGNYYISKIGFMKTHWWIFDCKFNIPNDDRSWRDVLDVIVNTISPGNEKKLKASINGMISGAYGNWKNKNKGNLEQFVENLIYRFNTPEVHYLLEHEDFLVFIKKRCEELFQRS